MPMDRTKTIIDPLAVMSMDVHDVFSAFTNTTAPAGSSVKIPSSVRYRQLFACVNPVTAGMIVHRRVDRGLSRNVLELWRNKQIAWNATGGVARMEDIHGKLIGMRLLCDFCDCGGRHCRTNDTLNVVDFSITNLYGNLIVSELDKFIKSDFRLP